MILRLTLPLTDSEVKVTDIQTNYLELMKERAPGLQEKLIIKSQDQKKLGKKIQEELI